MGLDVDSVDSMGFRGGALFVPPDKDGLDGGHGWDRELKRATIRMTDRMRGDGSAAK